MGKFDVVRNLIQAHQTPLFCSAAESLIQRDPVFNLKHLYFMTRDELYEDAVQKRFHLEKLAWSLGWSEDGPERIYADRCSSRAASSERLACNP